MKDQKQSNYDKFTKTRSYQDLLLKYHLFKTGVWRVQGEDPNCDMGGHHSKPELGFFEGVLDDVIHHAVELPSFWQWGSGGSIQKVEITKLDPATIARQKELKDQKAELERQLAKINTQLNQ